MHELGEISDLKVFRESVLSAALSRLYRFPGLNAIDLLCSTGSIHEEDPFLDDCVDSFCAQIGAFLSRRGGWVYLASVSSRRARYKIGMTRKSPVIRERSLNSAGVVDDLEIVEAFKVLDAPGVERFLHQFFSKHRHRKEFFDFQDESSAISAIETCRRLTQRCDESIESVFAGHLTGVTYDQHALCRETTATKP